jgi:two-component system chemotaxis response regulator CheB
MPDRIKVLVVDDSVFMRQVLGDMIGRHDDMTVVGTASDAYDAREKIKQFNPDVITLDVHMPRMDGITFLKNLMRLRPMPVIMVSTVTEKGADITLEALRLGACDYVTKPKDGGAGIEEHEQELVDKIRAAARVNMAELERRAEVARQPASRAPSQWPDYEPRPGMIVAIGASTGGTEAIKEVLMGLPANCPPVVITQHIPPQFSASFATRMNTHCAMHVHEASQHQKLLAGNVYIAPGGLHLRVIKTQDGLVCALDDAERVNRHRPSVEVLFDSLVELGYKRCVAALLTGMGADGAAALGRLKAIGAHTIVQDEKTSVVWGMPRVAFQMDAHCEVRPLQQMARRILELTHRAAAMPDVRQA